MRMHSILECKKDVSEFLKQIIITQIKKQRKQESILKCTNHSANTSKNRDSFPESPS